MMEKEKGPKERMTKENEKEKVRTKVSQNKKEKDSRTTHMLESSVGHVANMATLLRRISVWSSEQSGA